MPINNHAAGSNFGKRLFVPTEIGSFSARVQLVDEVSVPGPAAGFIAKEVAIGQWEFTRTFFVANCGLGTELDEIKSLAAEDKATHLFVCKLDSVDEAEALYEQFQHDYRRYF